MTLVAIPVFHPLQIESVLFSEYYLVLLRLWHPPLSIYTFSRFIIYCNGFKLLLSEFHIILFYKKKQPKLPQVDTSSDHSCPLPHSKVTLQWAGVYSYYMLSCCRLHNMHPQLKTQLSRTSEKYLALRNCKWLRLHRRLHLQGTILESGIWT